MGDLTAHFSRHEFECKCGCGSDFINSDHVDLLEDFRAYLGEQEGVECRIHVLSAVRCPPHNERIGSKPTSQHTWDPGLRVFLTANRPCASDVFITLRDGDGWRLMPLTDMHGHALAFGKFGGVGRYKWGLHLDSRSGRKARWKGN